MIGLDRIINSLDGFLGDYFGISIPDVQITDVVEIIIIAFFFYQVLKWVQNTRTWILFRGVLIIIGFFVLAALLQMNTILWLGEKLLNVALFMVIVVFQPELRKALANLGRKNIFSLSTADHKPNYMLLYKAKNNPIYTYLRFCYDNALIRFDNDDCKTMFSEVMQYQV